MHHTTKGPTHCKAFKSKRLKPTLHVKLTIQTFTQAMTLSGVWRRAHRIGTTTAHGMRSLATTASIGTWPSQRRTGTDAVPLVRGKRTESQGGCGCRRWHGQEGVQAPWRAKATAQSADRYSREGTGAQRKKHASREPGGTGRAATTTTNLVPPPALPCSLNSHAYLPPHMGRLPPHGTCAEHRPPPR